MQGARNRSFVGWFEYEQNAVSGTLDQHCLGVMWMDFGSKLTYTSLVRCVT